MNVRRVEKTLLYLGITPRHQARRQSGKKQKTAMYLSISPKYEAGTSERERNGKETKKTAMYLSISAEYEVEKKTPSGK